MEWNDFAIQVEDPQLNVFQLGYVNLPTAEIKGVEAEMTYLVTTHGRSTRRSATTTRKSPRRPS